MKTDQKTRSLTLALLIAAQLVCAAFFAGDVIHEGPLGQGSGPLEFHFYVEGLAVVALLAAVAFEIRYLRGLLRRQAHLEQQMGIAAGAFHEVIEAHFEDWGLTPSERDVAMFLIKGLSIQEIADARGSAEGTVKSHLNGVYRKAGVGNRGALLSLLIEDLMGEPLVPGDDKDG